MSETRLETGAQVLGPALLYVPTSLDRPLGYGDGETVMYRIDNGTIMDSRGLPESNARRERAVLRALLRHALLILEEEENRV